MDGPSQWLCDVFVLYETIGVSEKITLKAKEMRYGIAVQ